jgi:hypothetical protein
MKEVNEIEKETKEKMTANEKLKYRELQADEFEKTALAMFEKYVEWLELHYEEWECTCNPVGEPNFEMRWSAKICVNVGKDVFKVKCAGHYGFMENVKAVDFKQMFAIVCGVGMHPRGEMFNWILNQERQWRLGDEAHDSIPEVLLRGTIASLFIAGVARPEIENAFKEQAHLEYNIARVNELLKGDQRKRHEKKH